MATDKRGCSEASWEHVSARCLKNGGGEWWSANAEERRGTNNLKMKILSDLGGIQEAHWNESEIQAALLDELVLHLEMTFQNEEEMSERITSN